jgi:hypothetical protein
MGCGYALVKFDLTPQVHASLLPRFSKVNLQPLLRAFLSDLMARTAVWRQTLICRHILWPPRAHDAPSFFEAFRAALQELAHDRERAAQLQVDIERTKAASAPLKAASRYLLRALAHRNFARFPVEDFLKRAQWVIYRDRAAIYSALRTARIERTLDGGRVEIALDFLKPSVSFATPFDDDAPRALAPPAAAVVSSNLPTGCLTTADVDVQLSRLKKLFNLSCDVNDDNGYAIAFQATELLREGFKKFSTFFFLRGEYSPPPVQKFSNYFQTTDTSARADREGEAALLAELGATFVAREGDFSKTPLFDLAAPDRNVTPRPNFEQRVAADAFLALEKTERGVLEDVECLKEKDFPRFLAAVKGLAASHNARMEQLRVEIDKRNAAAGRGGHSSMGDILEKIKSMRAAKEAIHDNKLNAFYFLRVLAIKRNYRKLLGAFNFYKMVELIVSWRTAEPPPPEQQPHASERAPVALTAPEELSETDVLFSEMMARRLWFEIDEDGVTHVVDAVGRRVVFESAEGGCEKYFWELNKVASHFVYNSTSTKVADRMGAIHELLECDAAFQNAKMAVGGGGGGYSFRVGFLIDWLFHLQSISYFGQ